MKRLFILALMAILGSTCTQAQSWQWAKRIGGASYAHHSCWVGVNPITEHLLDITTDPGGNVYLLYSDRDSLLTADGHALSGPGKDDIILSSFTCDGAYRWSKVIGTSLDTDRAVAVKTDGVGGVYVCGMMPWLANAPGHIDRDTTISSAGRTMFLAKWDTAGNYKWLRMPQPDTISRNSAHMLSSLIDMDVDNQGNSYLLAYLTPGAYAGRGYVVTTKGMYVLVYGAAGQFIRAVPIPISITAVYYTDLLCTQTHLTYNANRDRFIITGMDVFGPATVGGTSLPAGAAYVGTFNALTGTMGFLKSSAPSYLFIPGRAKTDAQDNIYIAGLVEDSTTFNGVTFYNRPVFPHNRTVPFAMKMDATTGNAVWTLSGQTPPDGNAGGCAIAVAGNKVLLGGFFYNKLVFPTDSFSNNPAVDGQDCFIAQLDAGTGAIQRTATLGGPGSYGSAYPVGGMDNLFKIGTDRRGNFYVTGTFDTGRLTVGSTILQSAGLTDAYVAKWGLANCNCIVPIPSFTASPASGKTVRYTYNGSLSGIDSLVWTFGDGTKQKLTSGFSTQIIHNFPDNGYYTVCVTAYSATCGNNTFCRQTPLSAGSLSALGDVQVYPNPTTSSITIEGMSAGGKAMVVSMIGQQVAAIAITSNKQILNLSGLPAGTYLVVLSDNNGSTGTVRISKE